ncbi:MAG: hypothetical protein U9O87_08550 [Verrucomicrobiota bacterium]|nr:hypothetical protein [Verrucomicrobiota bacterium]
MPALRGWKKKHLTEWEMMSHSMVVISIPEEDKKTILGFTGFNNFEAYFVFHTDGESFEVSAWCKLEGITLKNASSIKLEPFVIAEEENFNNLLENYADYVGRKNSARIPSETVTGWIDWQYYREEKCEADVLRTMHAMKKLTYIGYPLKYIVIDGGWCDFASK